MGRMDCDIIKDLVPSYLDGICSERSRQAVEEHLEECEGCREYVQTLRKTEIVGKKAVRGEMDYMKKVRHHFQKKNVINFIWIVMVVFAGFACIMASNGDIRVVIDKMKLYEILPPAAAVGLMLLLKGGQECSVRTGKRIAFGILSMAGTCYGAGIIFAIIRWGLEKPPFGMPVSSLGPFVEKQYFFMVVFQLCIFVWSVLDSMKRECRCGLLSVVSLLGAFYALSMDRLLYNMDTVESFREQIFARVLVFGLEGVMLAVLLAVLSRRAAK